MSRGHDTERRSGCEAVGFALIDNCDLLVIGSGRCTSPTASSIRARRSGAAAAAIGGLSVCVKKSAETLQEKQVALAGLVSAFIFAVQMLNFPVASGTSGHLLGGLLAAVLVGPWVGALCVSVVLLVQGLVFADGGLTALGLNVVNMALVTALGGWLLFRGLRLLLPRVNRSVVIAAGIAGFASRRARVAGVHPRVRARWDGWRIDRNGRRRDDRRPRADRDRRGRDHGSDRRHGARRPAGSRLRGDRPANPSCGSVCSSRRRRDRDVRHGASGSRSRSGRSS